MRQPSHVSRRPLDIIHSDLGLIFQKRRAVGEPWTIRVAHDREVLSISAMGLRKLRASHTAWVRLLRTVSSEGGLGNSVGFPTKIMAGSHL